MTLTNLIAALICATAGLFICIGYLMADNWWHRLPRTTRNLWGPIADTVGVAVVIIIIIAVIVFL